MKIKFIFLFLAFSLFSCSTTKLVHQWKSPETPVFEANKVLVIGMSSNEDTRRMYEETLTSQLEKKDIVAVRSIDFFGQSFTDAEKSEDELNEIESQLLEAGFDAVLFSKITGSVSKTNLVNSFNSFSNNIDSFRDYFYENQNVYYKEQKRESYQVYHSETSLYCICPGKERELLWKGSIDIVDPQKTQKSISDYVKVLIREFEDQQLLVVQ